MCLGKVEWAGEPTYSSTKHAWKIFERPNYGMYYGGPYEMGKWYLADVRTTHFKYVWDGAYEVGFHAYRQREDAINVTEALQDAKLAICLVRLMGVKAIGHDCMNRQCLVADWMMPLEQYYR